MALKTTIYKFSLALSDFEQEYYEQLELTVAQHPSETEQRMLVRVLAYCLNIHKGQDLKFTKGLSSVEEPDIWLKDLTDQTLLWIDVGEPSYERLKKVTRLSNAVSVYAFNSKSNVWWQQSSRSLSELNVQVYAFNWEQILSLSALLSRTVNWAITISEQSIFIADDNNHLELNFNQLQ